MAPVRVWLKGASGLRMAADRFGVSGAPRVVLVHGGGQTRLSWKGVGAAVAAAGYQVWSIDARGHGDSDWSPDGDYRMEAMRDDLAACIAQIGGDAVIVGASMGGIMGLLVAGEVRPSVCRGLALVDVTPQVNPAGRERILNFMRSQPHGFASLDEAAAAVAAFSVNRPRPRTADGLRRNLRERDGRLYWHWDPKFLSTWDFGPDTAERMEAATRAIEAPVVLVHASLSEVVKPEDVELFQRLLPRATYVQVRDAGHMISGDQNDAFQAAIIAFLSSLTPVTAQT